MRAFATLLLVAGCSSPVTSYTLAFTGNVTDAQANLATDAAHEWQTRVPGLSFRFERREFDIAAQDTIWIYGADVAPDLARTAWGDGVATMRVGTWTRDTLAHELGHAMGLQHSRCGVMQARVNPYRDDGVQACDGVQLRASWGEP